MTECTPLTPCYGCQAAQAVVRTVNRTARRLGRRLGRSRWFVARYRDHLERWAVTHCSCRTNGRLIPSIDCPAHGCFDEAHEYGVPCPRCGSRYSRV